MAAIKDKVLILSQKFNSSHQDMVNGIRILRYLWGRHWDRDRGRAGGAETGLQAHAATATRPRRAWSHK